MVRKAHYQNFSRRVRSTNLLGETHDRLSFSVLARPLVPKDATSFFAASIGATRRSKKANTVIGIADDKRRLSVSKTGDQIKNPELTKPRFSAPVVLRVDDKAKRERSAPALFIGH